jgi:GT2 family glycosyltransferase
MDGDDISMPQRLGEQYKFLKNNPEISVVGSFVKMIDEEGNITGQRIKFTDPDKIKQEFLIQSSLVHPAVMYYKKCVLKVGGYRDKYLYTEDMDLWYRLVYNDYKISNVPEFSLQYREHSNSTSKLNRQKIHIQLQSRLDIIRLKKIKLRYILPLGFFYPDQSNKN